ncbi:hypothetical protein [Clostridium sp.]|jgi:hypothetical protein|uniref:hypothetical protein n=1 Tax=Clostridium sp. TaxID=1506 RepID=UPI0025864A13|nr:hypothetical protein [Clostridium sp.]MDF2502832.1 hypothetical protein [Clostridium sp.]
MARLNISISEVLTLIEKNADYDKKRVRKLQVINDNQIEITVGISSFLPGIKVILIYNKYENGKLYFTLNSNDTIINMFMGFINKTDSENFVYVHNKRVIVEINKLLIDKFSGVKISDLNINGEQIYADLEIN